MKALIDVTPSSEQLALFSRTSPGVEVIRGAAGSGKTTTALLKLRSAVGFYLSRAKRMPNPTPVNVLVLTYNKTLRGYISELTNKQLQQEPLVNLDVFTFNAWANRLLRPTKIILGIKETSNLLGSLSTEMKLDNGFAADEASYALGRFLPENIEDYLSARREGRGITPRMERPARQLLLDTVIRQYQNYKNSNNMIDWNDLAASLAMTKLKEYHVIVVDETQDFSANEIRAVLNQRSADATVTFVLDSAQRIYSRNFSWMEVGVTLRSDKSSTLQTNYRNTKQIAHFAAALLEGLSIDDNGTMPNFDSAIEEGEKPKILVGSYPNQVEKAIEYIKSSVDLSRESVAFLHPKGWFSGLIPALKRNGMAFVSLTGEAEWPQGTENIALCTIHSCKGLEFDHVIMIGIDGSVVDVQAPDEADADYEPSARFRRLIAMGVGRAKKGVIIGFKKEDSPDIIRYFDSDLCQGIAV
ncbi:UvrD-helicase domain-containing protein [Pseudomonas fluorescens]|uniref:UvrD-helicase domain-containing protein n=1 Tax=Pseudomonas fluorescens TaxID=294 RepID=UPI001474183A|nr:UvrD-helicase domain-containing protein [Pseudomonas fluorescens]NNB69307.1 AAA family ATPase [Pseudomonas fluorescens]